MNAAPVLGRLGEAGAEAPGSAPSAAFCTLGCKVNQYETQRLVDAFERAGFRVVPPGARADVCVLNSCSVTATAEQKSRQALRRLLRRSEGAAVVLTGCWVEMARRTGAPLPESSVLVPNATKLEALDRLLEARPDLASRLARRPTGASLPASLVRTRAVLKVQDGCDQHCAFCSIPLTRGAPRSRPASDVLAEARAVATSGRREIVVTGVLLGSYGPDTGSGGPSLPDLLRALAAIEGIERVRLSSLEPNHATPELLDAIAETPTLCRHLHLPLQSGSSRVLAAMGRPYRREAFVATCRDAQRLVPGLAITTDIIVGFPGETRSAFAETLAVVRDVGFARSHVFRYSARPGTPAATTPDQVSDEEKEARARELSEACRAEQERWLRALVGTRQQVLAEGKEAGDGLLAGYTSSYVRVTFAGPRALVGSMVGVRILGAGVDQAWGQMEAEAQAARPNP